MAADRPHPQTGSGLTVDERKELGRERRKAVPRSSQGDWAPSPTRPDPLAVLAAQDQDRVDFLVPIRHKRMSQSAFTFYRGTAAIMAHDLADTPASGLDTQICGDAHLSNFGTFASPERALLFDVNDFDETLTGPWEWDLKRLTTSLVLAARSLGLSHKKARSASAQSIGQYRTAMREFSGMSTLELWYDRVTVQHLRERVGDSKYRKGFDRSMKKARRRNSLRAFGKLAEVVDGRARFRSDPPLLIPAREIAPKLGVENWEEQVHASFDQYKETLNDEMRSLLSRYALVDVALKVVGVGSVGTRCFAVLLLGRDESDPLLLQIKEAGPSVLETELDPSPYEYSGHRVVEGQRLMQAFGDTLLGWSRGGREGRDFYWRQLKDMKGSADIATMNWPRLRVYAGACGWTLARAHARAGDPVAIAGYLGKSERFSDAVTSFAERYADQAETDFSAFTEAIASGAMASQAPEDSPVRR